MSGEPKVWWQSRTIWGAIVMLVALVVRTTVPGKEFDEDAVLSGVMGVVDAAAALLVIFGRLNAKSPIRGQEDL